MVHRYNKGYRFELIIKKEYEKNGWKVVRSSGSHSTVDLVCMKDGQAICLQCKNIQKFRLSRTEEAEIREWVTTTGLPVYLVSRNDGTKVMESFLP